MKKIDKLILEQEEPKKGKRAPAEFDVDPDSFEAIGDKVFSPLNMELAGELGIYSLGFQLADFGTKYATKKIAKEALKKGAVTLGQKFIKSLATSGLCTVFMHPGAVGACVFAKNTWFVAETAYFAGSLGYWYSRKGEGTEKVALSIYDPTVFAVRQGWLEKSLSGAEDQETAKLSLRFQSAQRSIRSNTPLKEEIAIRNARLLTGIPQYQSVKKLGKWITFDEIDTFHSMRDRLEMCTDVGGIPHFVSKEDTGEYYEIETNLDTWREDLKPFDIDEEGLQQIKWPVLKRKVNECLTDETYLKRYTAQVPAVIRYVLAYSVRTEMGFSPEEIWDWAVQAQSPEDAAAADIRSSTVTAIKGTSESKVPYGCVLKKNKENFESVMTKLITLSRRHPDYKWMKEKILEKDQYSNCNEDDFAIWRAIRAFQQENLNIVSYQKNGKIFYDTGKANERTVKALEKRINEIPESNK